MIGESLAEFPPYAQNKKELRSDDGRKIFMRGKKYFFLLLETKQYDFDIKQSEFDDYQWLDLKQAKSLAEKIAQPGKKRLTLEIIDSLKKEI